MNQYGLPYMGSKSKIATYIINTLPSADNFYDLFAGGCAITHRVLLTNKYKNIYFNDINGVITQLFLDAINGKYKNETRWISREDFFKLKDTEEYVALCWSFGNSQRAYMYGEYIEPWKKALHYVRVLNDYSLLKEMGINGDGSRLDIKKHKEEYKQKYIEWYKKHYDYDSLSKVNKIGLENLKSLESLEGLQRLESLQRLERLQSLESLQRLQRLERLQRYCRSYEEVPIKPNSVIYCDIPYENTAEYISGAFNHKAFYDWACNQKELVIISSYNISDDRFMEISSIQKDVLLSNLQNKEKQKHYEVVYIPKNQKELYEKMMNRKLINQEKSEQLSLF